MRGQCPEHSRATDGLDMAAITHCVVCCRFLAPEREHVDTCSGPCFRWLLAKQRGEVSSDDEGRTLAPVVHVSVGR